MRRLIRPTVARTPIRRALLALALALALLALSSDPAEAAATFTVNKTGDAGDRRISDTACDTSRDRGEQCTLRAAIQEANDTPNDTTGPDLIRFNIVSTASVKTISPASALPTITEAVTINGYTQSGASENTLATGNNAVLKIQLNGANAGTIAIGLEIRAPNSTIKGLVINRFRNDGVRIILGQATGNKVEGNFIGTNAAGTADRGNGVRGVAISSASDNTVGGTQPARRNVISGNGFDGVLLNGGEGNEVLGNFIGTNASGTQDLRNSNDGVDISGGSNHTIGGTAAGARNVISGNGENGVEIFGSNATPSKVQGNFIGTSANGTGDLGNAANGVSIDNGASNHTVGGTDADDGAVDGVVRARNVISGNDENGVEIFGFETTDIKVQGNLIGTNAAGTAELSNGDNGVELALADDNTIGGTAAGAGNVISGNGDEGVQISDGATGNEVLGNFIGTNATGNADLGNIGDGVRIFNARSNTIGGTTSAARNVISGNDGVGFQVFNPSATGNKVQGNYIGTDASGTQALGNGRGGVFIGSASNNTIGGTAAGAGNVISGNEDDGVAIFGSSATGNRVEGNRIGLKADGTEALPNALDGVLIQNAPDNTVGGTDSGAGNIISGNGADGVSVVGGTGNSVLSNRIFDNGGLGIDLGDDGVTDNDPDDPDTGANNLQNFPVVTSAARSSSTGNTTITGTINSNPQQFFTIQCFVAAPDPSGHGEETFLVQTTTTTNANGDGNFVCVTPNAAVGQAVTATATNTSGTAAGTSIGDTSEFSLNVGVEAGP